MLVLNENESMKANAVRILDMFNQRNCGESMGYQQHTK